MVFELLHLQSGRTFKKRDDKSNTNPAHSFYTDDCVKKIVFVPLINTDLLFRFREKQHWPLILRNIMLKPDREDGLINQTSEVLTTEAEYKLNRKTF